MRHAAKFWYALAWVCYVLASSIIYRMAGFVVEPVERVHVLVLGCFFLLLAIYHRGDKGAA